MSDCQVLIYGYGNPGRQDDGLGNAFVEEIKAWAAQEKLEGIEFDSNYQLNIEDAAGIAEKELVIFADASVEEDVIDFELTPVTENTEVSFTSHAASPGYIYYLSKALFGKQPATYLLHIKGYTWNFEEGLSEKATRNLNLAVEALKIKLRNPQALIRSFKHKN